MFRNKPIILCNVILRAWFVRHRHYLERTKLLVLVSSSSWHINRLLVVLPLSLTKNGWLMGHSTKMSGRFSHLWGPIRSRTVVFWVDSSSLLAAPPDVKWVCKSTVSVVTMSIWNSNRRNYTCLTMDCNNFSNQRVFDWPSLYVWHSAEEGISYLFVIWASKGWEFGINLIWKSDNVLVGCEITIITAIASHVNVSII